MRIIVYSTRIYETHFLKEALVPPLETIYAEQGLSLTTASLASGCKAACIFTNDDASAPVLKELHTLGVKFLAVRAAGYDHVDLRTAAELGIRVANVPEYSPYAIAEHAVALILALNRRLMLAHEQVHQYNFTLNDLVGFDLNNKTVALVGTGRIGKVMAKILNGFGCKLLAYDLNPDENLENAYDVHYGLLADICGRADIVSVHLPLTKDTHYLINKEILSACKKGVMLINTARGGVLQTEDCLRYLENGHIGYLGLDVYEKEKGLFFHDHSQGPLRDPMLLKLLAYRNVLITPHQGFATKDALQNIADTTSYNLTCWNQNRSSENELVDPSTLPAV